MQERHAGVGIIFIGHHVQDQDLKDVVTDGDSVSLRIGKETILVRNIRAIRPAHFKGVIHGFEPSFATQHGQLCVGQEIEFSESHIFGCQSAEQSRGGA